MDAVWTIMVIGFDVSYDGIIDPQTTKTDLKIYKDFAAAGAAFRAQMKEIGDTDSVRESFLNEIHEGLVDENMEDEIQEEAEKVEILRSVIDNLLSGRESELITDEQLAKFKASSESLNLLSLDLLPGAGILEIEDLWGWGYQHPELKTNALFSMDDPDKTYYLRLENWLGKDHKFFLAELRMGMIE